MLCGIDLFGFFDWSVIEPENDVSIVVELGTTYGDGFIGILRKYRERTCGVKANAPNGRGIDAVLIEDSLN